MSRFVDKNHEYNDLCLDELGIKKMKEKMQEMIEVNKKHIIESIEEYKVSTKYRIFEVSNDIIMVINNSSETKTCLCIGYPFPIYEVEMNIDFINQIIKNKKIEVKLFIRGKLLRSEQKKYIRRYMEKEFTSVDWVDVLEKDNFKKECAKQIETIISNASFFYFDPYSFVGDSILGLSFIDWFNRAYGEQKFVVFSKAYKHLNCFFESLDYLPSQINNVLNNSNVLLMPDLIDNHLGQTLKSLSNIEKDVLVLIIGRNMLVDIHNQKCKVINCDIDDVLLLNQNINDYMYDCISPFFVKDLQKLNNNRLEISKKAKTFFINPFSSTKDKDFSVEFVIQLVQKIYKKCGDRELKVYISAGDGTERVKSWLEKFKTENSVKSLNNVNLLFDKGLGDLGNILSNEINACITTDTAISHLITRLGIPNITIYKNGFWDDKSIQSLSAESPIGFCSYRTNQFLGILKDEDIHFADYCTDALISISESNVEEINNDIKELVLKVEQYLLNPDNEQLEIIIKNYESVRSSYKENEWLFRLYNPVYFTKIVKEINSMYPLSDILKSVWRISNIYKFVKRNGGENFENR